MRLVAGAAVFTARPSLAEHYYVPSGSILPTVHGDDRVIVDKLACGLRLPFLDTYAVTFGGPSRGDVVVLAGRNARKIEYLEKAVAAGLHVLSDKPWVLVPGDVPRLAAVLDEAGVCRAAIESCAENFSDGVVAPAFWLALLGLPGLIAYKAINTADSMIGHRSERYDDIGWAAARLDALYARRAELTEERADPLALVAGGEIPHLTALRGKDGKTQKVAKASSPSACDALSSSARTGWTRRGSSPFKRGSPHEHFGL